MSGGQRRADDGQVGAAEPAEGILGLPAAGACRALEELLEPRRGHDHQQTSAAVARYRPGMRCTAWDEDAGARACSLDTILEPDADRPVDHVYHLVERRVDVQRRPLGRSVRDL